ncbi:MAG: deoxyguanosinetriphosphate triphosphohydrolase [Clostridium sp.]|uniref:deoxyguanosinetriphosphate triphosphohydrolase n=1 Tax=Clostridium culturomicium TaxID=1499683 RepID=UPI00058BFFF8|nr:deoxyguanosinetriphosphate triphosphohydrolase [Clostridium culturomicium]MDU4888905.1 deoxyguanosinetriphosphate triphosphohydrolase [Clostridium sp.]MDU7083451.1 deoxyguanosinetriphosphate triphosphohydrolase [Clostridium sp.]
MNVRNIIEQREEKFIIPAGAKSKDSLGRQSFEELDEVRTCYMVDRDRIIHCKSFRRLKRKTQVYIKTWNDHYRTRLTHTLEVAQVGRTIGRGLGLNEDLIEAIALGHDIGHVAFAHSGEEVLNEILPNGFSHNENSIRVLTKLENNGTGLNLSKEVLDGILFHSGFSSTEQKSHTLEGQVVKYSDKIAYVNHDIDDSLRAKILFMEDIPRNILEVLGDTHGRRIDTLVRDCIKQTNSNIEEGKLQVGLSKKIDESFKELRNFMFKEVYNGKLLRNERDKAKFILEQLFKYFYNHQDKLPEFYRNISINEGKHQGVADYLSGMSDEYCISIFKDIFIP